MGATHSEVGYTVLVCITLAKEPTENNLNKLHKLYTLRVCPSRRDFEIAYWR